MNQKENRHNMSLHLSGNKNVWITSRDYNLILSITFVSKNDDILIPYDELLSVVDYVFTNCRFKFSDPRLEFIDKVKCSLNINETFKSEFFDLGFGYYGEEKKHETSIEGPDGELLNFSWDDGKEFLKVERTAQKNEPISCTVEMSQFLRFLILFLHKHELKDESNIKTQIVRYLEKFNPEEVSKIFDQSNDQSV